MNIKTILLAVDLTENPGDITERVFSRLKCKDAQLFIIHVIQDISRVSLYADAYPLWEQYRDRACKDTIIRLDEYIKALSGPFSDIQPLVEVGDPAGIIVEKAEKLNVDLVVVGNHCRQGIDHLLHRNVSEKVMRLAKREIISFYIC
ncbi:MAG TPA: universal stress protein [Spirochaetota bacterium]|nr:universal stress protein [Spirochaetota bacterium]